MYNNISFLIIDDDVNICYLFDLIFEGYNISCTSVNSLAAAKIELKSRIPTFVIIDSTLPIGNAIEFVEYLNTDFPCIKVIMFNNYNLKSLLKNKKPKIFQIIEKPFTLQKIRVIIDSLKKLPRCTSAVKCFPQACSNFNA